MVEVQFSGYAESMASAILPADIPAREAPRRNRFTRSDVERLTHFDRIVKSALHSRASVGEYWVLEIRARLLSIHRRLRGW